jgi:hypothetical protein
MNVTPEKLAAFADDELDANEALAIGAAIAADPLLQAKVAAHRALRSKLSAHFAPVVEAEVPERLRRAALDGGRNGEVVDFAAVAHRRVPPPVLRYGLPALAASLVLAVLGYNALQSRNYAGGAVAEALDRQIAFRAPADAPVRVLLTFRNGEGQFCRAYSSGSRSGIACRDDLGWHVRYMGGAEQGQQTDYRQAGSADVAAMAAAQAMAVGPALDAKEEAAAAKRRWQP